MEQSIIEIAGRVRSGEITSTELVEQSLAKVSANTSLNVLITVDADGALSKAARIDKLISQGRDAGALAGVPIIIKDNLNVEGLRTTAGTPGIDFIAPASGAAVARLEHAGAIVIGKANMHELAFGVTSNNRAFGAVRNPADTTRFPGGSSGGTAAAIAAGIVAGGLGTDTVGSVRVPAALCGVVGFRPTTWRMEQSGAVPAVPMFDVIGPITRSLADAAVLNSVMTGGGVPAPRDPRGLRIGVGRLQSENTSEGVATAFAAACSRLRESGAILVDVDLSKVVTECFAIGYTIGFFEMKSRMIEFLEEYQPQTTLDDVVHQIASEDVKAVYVRSVVGEDCPTEEAYVEAKANIDAIRRLYLAALDQHSLDAVMWPTVPLEAQPINGTQENVVLNGEVVPTTPTFIRNQASAGVIGAPAVSLPMGVTAEGLPVGLELDGRPDADQDLISIGLGVEAALATRI